MNPGADALVLEVAEQPTLEQGLAFDRCQIAVVTTTRGAASLARPGADDEATIEKAIRAPVDVVSPDGWAVLSATDPATTRLTEHCKGRLVLFGGSREESPLREHLTAGGAALIRLGSQLIWQQDGLSEPPLNLAAGTEWGDASSVEPVMAAAAALLALGVSRSAVQELLNNSVG
jgi:cyanophycin synthetase